MSRPLALLGIACFATSAQAALILPYDPFDTGNWVKIQFSEPTPTGRDWFFFNSYNGVRHRLADTGMAFWRLKNTPTPIDPDNFVATGLFFTDGGVQKQLTIPLRGDEQQGHAPVEVAIGLEEQIPWFGVTRPAHLLTFNSSFGTRQMYGLITVPEPSALAMIATAATALAVRRRR